MAVNDIKTVNFYMTSQGKVLPSFRGLILTISLNKIIFYASQVWDRVRFWTGYDLEESYYSKLGSIYFRSARYKRAITMFLKSEKAHSGRDFECSKYNRYYLGHCYLNLGDFQNACKHFEYYHKYNPNDHEISVLLAWCYELVAQPEAALKVYQQISEKFPEAPTPYIESAKILSDLGRKDEALQCLEKVTSKYHDSNAQAIINAISCAIRGDLTNAILKLKETYPRIDFNASYAPGYSSFYPELFKREDLQIMLAQWQKESGDISGSLMTIEAVYEKNKNDVWILNDLATAYADQNIKLEEALSLIDRALTEQPENSLFLDTKAWILFKMGEKEQAKKIIEKSLNLNPNYLEIQNHYREISIIE